MSHQYPIFCTQAFRTINSALKYIEERSVRDFVNAPQDSMVNKILYSSASLMSSLFHTDADYTVRRVK
jgi:hypothetical protein